MQIDANFGVCQEMAGRSQMMKGTVGVLVVVVVVGGENKSHQSAYTPLIIILHGVHHLQKEKDWFYHHKQLIEVALYNMVKIPKTDKKML